MVLLAIERPAGLDMDKALILNCFFLDSVSKIWTPDCLHDTSTDMDNWISWVLCFKHFLIQYSPIDF